MFGSYLLGLLWLRRLPTEGPKIEGLDTLLCKDNNLGGSDTMNTVGFV